MSSDKLNAQKNGAPSEKKISTAASVYEWVEVLCMALFTVVVLFTFVFRLVTVDGHSMDTTFAHGDRLLISDLFYEPKAGDVVVLQDITAKNELQGPIIKRIIATEGETVDIDAATWTVTVTHKDGTVTVLDEPYVSEEVKKNYEYMFVPTETYPYLHLYPNHILNTEYPHTVKEGHVFVMGDNRNISLDSRLLGDIDERMILGKVYMRIFPSPKLDFSK